jgi:hypothetical protein
MYGKISETDHPLSDHFTPIAIKPEFPDGGSSVRCPSCRDTCVYQRQQLRYRVP